MLNMIRRHEHFSTPWTTDYLHNNGVGLFDSTYLV